MNEQGLRVPLSQIRLLGKLPSDVEVVRVLSPWEDRTDWINQPNPPELFLRVRHRICFVAPVGGWLMCEDLEQFLSRYEAHQIIGQEAE